MIDELPRLREELARLGANVNLNAEADREELAERERFLREQMDDLARGARDAARHDRRRSRSRPRAVQRHVRASERGLLGNVRAAVPGRRGARCGRPTPSNLSESGIEIAVQPPGKKMTALAALSGGERAMTAAALIFALIRVQSVAVLSARRGRCRARRRERRSLLGDGARGRERRADDRSSRITSARWSWRSRMYGVTMAEPGVSSIISARSTRSTPDATRGR